jgi:hypothetical protein
MPVTIPGVVLELLSAVAAFLKGAGDSAAEEEAMMQAQEAIKREMDRRKFGTG